ncbi:uncharacterized protein LOC111877650 [Lactuca sativa]|uniref:uncharacterized protein LOC111877650 n=1 Tax=Lactuca sativa TaxID=4236 RepID=UPI001C688C20|nr:uncharacterized protein LOC111877650 [Lactuca sativa]
MLTFNLKFCFSGWRQLESPPQLLSGRFSGHHSYNLLSAPDTHSFASFPLRFGSFPVQSVTLGSGVPRLRIPMAMIIRRRPSARMSQVQQRLQEAIERAVGARAVHNTHTHTIYNHGQRKKILQMEKNRINKDGELVISSTKTRTPKGNIEDALEKLQVIIDAASYVSPPPSEEQVNKITKIAAVVEQKRQRHFTIQYPITTIGCSNEEA